MNGRSPASSTPSSFAAAPGRVPLLLELPLQPGVEQDRAGVARARIGERLRRRSRSGAGHSVQARPPCAHRGSRRRARSRRARRPPRARTPRARGRARCRGTTRPLEPRERELERAPLERADLVPPHRRPRARPARAARIVRGQCGLAARRLEVLEPAERRGTRDRWRRPTAPHRGWSARAGLVHREAPARSRSRPRRTSARTGGDPDLSDAPVASGADGEEREEDAGLAGHGGRLWRAAGRARKV